MKKTELESLVLYNRITIQLLYQKSSYKNQALYNLLYMNCPSTQFYFEK